jgi:sterol desaturase/sphingolipid hydroxylase (fatty acid hydroxylase superfamily)
MSKSDTASTSVSTSKESVSSLYTQELLDAVDRWNGVMGVPTEFGRQHPKGIRVFKNSILEFGFARAHPIIPGLWVIPVSLFCLWKATETQTPLKIFVLTLLGILAWTATEYALHLLWFHRPYQEGMGKKFKFTQFMIHGYHHEFPNDPSRLVMPISVAWPLGALFAGLFWLVLPVSVFWSAFAGLILGYLSYDWVHYYTHHFRPKSGIGKYLREYHMVHHYKDFDHNFGISSPLWDWAFGKAIEPKTKIFGGAAQTKNTDQNQETESSRGDR